MTRKKPKNQRRKPIQARALAKYNAILEAAPRVLMEKGYRGCTTEAIALEAEVSIGTLYEYFGNKDAVFAVYLNQQVRGVMSEVAKEVTTHLSGTPEQMIEQLVRLGVGFVFRHHRIFSTIIREIPGLWETQVVRKLEDRIVELGEVIFMQQKFTLDRQEYRTVIIMLTNTVVGIYFRLATVGTRDFDPDSLTHEILCLVSGYIQTRTGIRLFRNLVARKR